MTFSAIMRVHDGVDPEHLRAAVDSIARQTLPPAELLVVEDGPLRPRLAAVLDDFALAHPGLLRRVALADNRGGGIAMDVALREARHDVVAHLDSDDIALPHRFAVQLRVMEEGGYDVVGSSMLEFEGRPENVLGVRRLPETPERIARYARFNSPINNPTAVIRRAAALAAGGVDDIRYVEDYDMYARMLAAGARMYNVPEPLVLFRVSEAMYRRRAGRSMIRTEWALQQRLHRYGLITRAQQGRNLLVRSAFRLLPGRVLRIVYRRAFRQVPTRPAREAR